MQDAEGEIRINQVFAKNIVTSDAGDRRWHQHSKPYYCLRKQNSSSYSHPEFISMGRLPQNFFLSMKQYIGNKEGGILPSWSTLGSFYPFHWPFHTFFKDEQERPCSPLLDHLEIFFTGMATCSCFQNLPCGYLDFSPFHLMTVSTVLALFSSFTFVSFTALYCTKMTLMLPREAMFSRPALSSRRAWVPWSTQLGLRTTRRRLLF